MLVDLPAEWQVGSKASVGSGERREQYVMYKFE